MVTELKERQEKQVTPASREETINRLDVIEQRISEMQSKSGITENMVQEILNQIGSIGKANIAVESWLRQRKRVRRRF